MRVGARSPVTVAGPRRILTDFLHCRPAELEHTASAPVNVGHATRRFGDHDSSGTDPQRFTPSSVSSVTYTEVSRWTTTVIVLIVVIVLLVVALAAAGVILARRKQSEGCRSTSAPSTSAASPSPATARPPRPSSPPARSACASLDIRDLRPEERDHYAASWSGIQRDFVDDPVRVGARTPTRLVTDIMRTRGYPVDDFDRRAEDISVEHPDVVQHYREARSVRDAASAGPSTPSSSATPSRPTAAWSTPCWTPAAGDRATTGRRRTATTGIATTRTAPATAATRPRPPSPRSTHDEHP